MIGLLDVLVIVSSIIRMILSRVTSLLLLQDIPFINILFDLVGCFIHFLEINDLNDLSQIDIKLNRFDHELHKSDDQTHHSSQFSQKHTVSIQLPVINHNFIMQKEKHPGQNMYFGGFVVLAISRKHYRIELGMVRIPVGLRIQFIQFLPVFDKVHQSTGFVKYSTFSDEYVCVPIVVQSYHELLKERKLHFRRFLVYFGFQVHLFAEEIDVEYYSFQQIGDLVVGYTCVVLQIL